MDIIFLERGVGWRENSPNPPPPMLRGSGSGSGGKSRGTSRSAEAACVVFRWLCHILQWGGGDGRFMARHSGYAGTGYM